MLSFYPVLLMVVTVAVILSRRSMYAILNLILLFVLVAFIVISLQVDFIGLIFIIVYVGAIATLFLFIIMMLGGEEGKLGSFLDVSSYQLLLSSGYRANLFSDLLSRASGYIKYAAVDILLLLSFGVFASQMLDFGLSANFNSGLDVAQVFYSASLFNSVYLYGLFFYNYGYLPFLMAGVVLLVAMLGSIILTTRLLTVGTEEKDGVKSKSPAPGEKDLPPEKPSIIKEAMTRQANKEKVFGGGFPFQFAGAVVCIFFSILLQPPILGQFRVLFYVGVGVGAALYLVGYAVIHKIVGRFAK